MNYLPDDILTQILVKVPCFKSILRCTSVCKSWNSCIISPTFITLHRCRPNITNFLFFDTTTESGLCDKARYLFLHQDPGILGEKYNLVFPDKLINQIVVYGCCNGLICYSFDEFTFGDSRRIYLWNPAIRKLKALPRYLKYYDYDQFSYTPSGFGFWFDKGANDYMVAKIFSTGEAYVYSLRTNTWRLIGESIPAGTTDVEFELAYVAGTLHWPANIGGNWMIYSLNIESGLFRDTTISCGCSDKKLLSHFCLTPLGEHSLAVFVFESSDSEGSIHCRCCMVQVYDQNLNKLYTIDVEKYPLIDIRVAGRRNYEALITKSEDYNVSGIVSWSTDTHECFQSYVGSIGDHGFILRGVRPFIETLVLLDDRDAGETSCPNYQLNLKTNSTT